jgi:hypothetical protein
MQQMNGHDLRLELLKTALQTKRRVARWDVGIGLFGVFFNVLVMWLSYLYWGHWTWGHLFLLFGACWAVFWAANGAGRLHGLREFERQEWPKD